MRSGVLLTGIGTGSLIESSGVKKIIAKNAAISQGISRRVCGQSSAGETAPISREEGATRAQMPTVRAERALLGLC